jgi:anti-sigma regulatory factor (Ser/Thr protein kinase)
MEVAFTESVDVTDPSSIGEARRTAMTLGQRLGFDETRAGELTLLAAEVSRNVLVHGGGGKVIFSGIWSAGSSGASILAMDSGPGISDITKALDDGYSTAGTMGGGLGAMKRMASGFEIFTSPTGTIVFLEIGQISPALGLQIAGLTLPYPGERVCGDAWAFDSTLDRTVVVVVDGLGHGLGASDAAQEAIATFRKHIDLKPGAILSYIHDALRKTRGAVAGVVEMLPLHGELRYAGVGNISAVLTQGLGSRNLMSHNGTLGVAAPRIQEFTFEWSSGAMLVLHSDGLQTRWDLGSYAGLTARHAAVIGGALLRDFRRQRDDASVVVIKAA